MWCGPRAPAQPRNRNDHSHNPGGTPGRANALEQPRRNSDSNVASTATASVVVASTALLASRPFGRLRAPVCHRDCRRDRCVCGAEKWIAHSSAPHEHAIPPLKSKARRGVAQLAFSRAAPQPQRPHPQSRRHTRARKRPRGATPAARCSRRQRSRSLTGFASSASRRLFEHARGRPRVRRASSRRAASAVVLGDTRPLLDAERFSAAAVDALRASRARTPLRGARDTRCRLPITRARESAGAESPRRERPRGAGERRSGDRAPRTSSTRTPL